MPEGFKIASAWVEVKPDLTGFTEKVNSDLEAAEREIQIPVALDKTKLAREVEETRGEVEHEPPLRIPVSLKTASYAEASARMRELEQELDAHPVKVPTTAQDPINAAFVAKLQSSIKAIAADSLKIPATPDMDAFRAKVDAALAEMSATSREKLDVIPDLARFRTEVIGEVEALQAEVKATIKVEPDEDSLAGLKKKTEKAADDTGRGAGGLMATAIAAGVVAGGPVVGAAMAGIGATGLIALGAVLNKGDSNIDAAWKTLATNARDQSNAMSFAMVQPITDAIDNIDADLTRQGPAFSRMFTSAAADIPILTTGLNDFTDGALAGFDAAIEHSQPIVQGLSSLLGQIGAGLSDIGNHVAASSGRIGTDLSELGTLVHTAESAIGSLISVTSGLAQGALPGMSGALHTVDAAMGGFDATLGSLEPAIGGIATVAIGARTAFSKLAPMSEKLAGSLASKGGLLGSMSGLADGIPIVGAAMTGLSLLEGILSSQSEQTAQAIADQARSSDNLNKSLGSLTNATQHQIDAAVQSNAANQKFFGDIGIDLPTTLRMAGVSMGDFTSAVEQGGPKLDAIRDKLYTYVAGLQHLDDTQQNVTDQQHSAGEAASTLAGQLGNLNQAWQNSNAVAAEHALQLAQLSLGTDHASLNTAQLASDIAVLGDDTSTTNARINALTDALHLMADNGAEPANDAIAQAWSTVNGLGSALQGTSGRLLEANGQLDLATTRGEAANTAIEGLRGQVSAYAQALSSQGASAADVQAKTQTLIDQMVGPLAKALGISVDQVRALIKQYDIVPQTIVTTITANTAPAYSAVNTLLSRISNASATVAVNIARGAGVHGVEVPQAAGHIVSFHAAGGFEGLSPMSPIAQVVPPSSWRVVGDRSDVSESYIPLDPGSPRSQAILTETNRLMGRSGGSTTNNWYVSTQDPYQTAQLVAAQQQWNALVGAR